VWQKRQCVIGDTLESRAWKAKKSGLQEPPETPRSAAIESNKYENERVVTHPVDELQAAK
jgi:hypothetical protein